MFLIMYNNSRSTIDSRSESLSSGHSNRYLFIFLFTSLTVVIMTEYIQMYTCIIDDHGYTCIPFLLVTILSFYAFSWLITCLQHDQQDECRIRSKDWVSFRNTWVLQQFFMWFRLHNLVFCIMLCVCFVNPCLYFCTFSVGHCVVCSSSIYYIWLHLWYLQTFFL